MLIQNPSLPRQQRGVILVVSLIILVALTIGGVALVRTVDTGSIVAGNLAFQQAATYSGEAGAETAIRYLESQSLEYLSADRSGEAYVSSTPASGNPSNWETYWTSTIDPTPVSLPYSGTAPSCSGRRCTLPTDAAGNTVTYTIQRLCQNTGDPILPATGCSSALQPLSKRGGSFGAASSQLIPPTQYFYRITARIDGPRNTQTYIQTIVAR